MRRSNSASDDVPGCLGRQVAGRHLPVPVEGSAVRRHPSRPARADATSGFDYLSPRNDWSYVRSGGATVARHADANRYIRSARRAVPYGSVHFYAGSPTQSGVATGGVEAMLNLLACAHSLACDVCTGRSSTWCNARVFAARPCMGDQG